MTMGEMMVWAAAFAMVLHNHGEPTASVRRAATKAADAAVDALGMQAKDQESNSEFTSAMCSGEAF